MNNKLIWYKDNEQFYKKYNIIKEEEEEGREEKYNKQLTEESKKEAEEISSNLSNLLIHKSLNEFFATSKHYIKTKRLKRHDVLMALGTLWFVEKALNSLSIEHIKHSVDVNFQNFPWYTKESLESIVPEQLLIRFEILYALCCKSENEQDKENRIEEYIRYVNDKEKLYFNQEVLKYPEYIYEQLKQHADSDALKDPRIADAKIKALLIEKSKKKFAEVVESEIERLKKDIEEYESKIEK